MDADDEARLKQLLGEWKSVWPEAARMETALREAEHKVAQELGASSREFSRALSKDLKTLELRVAASLLEAADYLPAAKTGPDALAHWQANARAALALRDLVPLRNSAMTLSDLAKSLDPFHQQVLGVPYTSEAEPPKMKRWCPMGPVTGRMSSSQLPPPSQRIPRTLEKHTMSTYIDSKGGEFTPETAYLFRDGHLINAVRRLRRENHNEVPKGFSWMLDELSKRGLREVAFKARESLQQQAIGLGYSGGPDGVRRIITELRDGVIHDKSVEINRMTATALSALAKSLDVDESLPKQKMVEDILSTLFPITETEAKMCRVRSLEPCWIDASGRETRADQFGNVYLTQVVELLSKRFAHDDIPEKAVWLFEEFVKRGLHRKKSLPLKVRHLPLISELEDRMSKMRDGEVEVPLLDLVKMKSHDTKESLFNKLREREKEAMKEFSRASVTPAEALRNHPTHAAAETATLKENIMSESPEELQAELEALEERKAALQAKLNEKKGLMGHPTAQMVSHGVIDGSKMLLATEAMDAVQALARKIALKFFIPEGHEAILDTPQGQMFVDMAMPIAIHLAASQGLFGPGSEFAATTAGYAFTGNWFKHGKGVTAKVKEVMGEFAGELNQLKELGKELMGLGQGNDLLSEVTDFAEKAEELAREKEKVEASG